MTTEKMELGPLQACCYLVYDEEKNAAVIDPGDEPERVAARLNQLGLTLRAVLLTHGHFDHVGGVNRLIALCPAPVYAGAGEEALLRDPTPPFAGFPAADPTPILPERWLKDGDTFSVGSVTFSVLASPGHTPGGVCYRAEDLLFSGDTLFAGSVGRTDLPGGSFALLSQTLARLSALPGELTVCPGHGPVTAMAREQKQNPYLGDLKL